MLTRSPIDTSSLSSEEEQSRADNSQQPVDSHDLNPITEVEESKI